MTLGEFKAWLEGYEVSFTNKAPNREQYAKIIDKLFEVGAVISVPHQPLAQGTVSIPNQHPYKQYLNNISGQQ